MIAALETAVVFMGLTGLAGIASTVYVVKRYKGEPAPGGKRQPSPAPAPQEGGM